VAFRPDTRRQLELDVAELAARLAGRGMWGDGE
jgi:hypothetical protein